jgi:hypothetical protein
MSDDELPKAILESLGYVVSFLGQEIIDAYPKIVGSWVFESYAESIIRPACRE